MLQRIAIELTLKLFSKTILAYLTVQTLMHKMCNNCSLAQVSTREIVEYSLSGRIDVHVAVGRRQKRSKKNQRRSETSSKMTTRQRWAGRTGINLRENTAIDLCKRFVSASRIHSQNTAKARSQINLKPIFRWPQNKTSGVLVMHITLAINQ